MSIAFPPIVVRLTQIAILLALAVLLWIAADGRAALSRLQDAHLGWLVGAGAVLALQTILSAQRWRVTAAQLGLHISAGAALREYYLAQVVNQSLPGGVVGDANRAVRSRSEVGLVVAAQAVLFERLAGQLGLIAVLVTGLSVSVAMPGVLVWPQWLATPVIVVLCLLAVAGGLIAMVPGLRRGGQAFWATVWTRNIRLQQVALSLGTALCNVAAFALCAVALNVAMPWVAVAALVPLILFAMVLPVSIGGWGVREGAAALLFPVMGATSAEGLATSVAFGLVFLVTILPGVIAPLFASNKHQKGPRSLRGGALNQTHITKKEIS